MLFLKEDADIRVRIFILKHYKNNHSTHGILHVTPGIHHNAAPPGTRNKEM
jgi:hypothetical protein